MIAQIPPRQAANQDTHAYWEDFLTMEEIKTLLSLPNWHEVESASVGNHGEGIVDHSKRQSNVAWFVPTEETEAIWQKIVGTIADVNSRFFNFDITGCYEPAQLTLYKSNVQGHYDWHVDSMPSSLVTPRKLSMSLLLSNPNNFKGGEFQVKVSSDEAITLEQKQGRAWFFPSYTLHRVAPVTKGIRQSLVLWVGGRPFR